MQMRPVGLAIVVILVTLLGAVAAFLFSAGQAQQYTATAVLNYNSLNPALQAVNGNSYNIGFAPDARLTATQAAQAASHDVAEQVAIRLDESSKSVQDHVRVTPETSANLVDVAASADSPQRALRLARVYVSKVIARQRLVQEKQAQQAIPPTQAQLAQERPASPQFAQLRASLVGLNVIARSGTGSPQLVQGPFYPASASSPKTTRNTLFGALFGAIVGLLLATLLTRTSGRWS